MCALCKAHRIQRTLDDRGRAASGGSAEHKSRRAQESNIRSYDGRRVEGAKALRWSGRTRSGVGGHVQPYSELFREKGLPSALNLVTMRSPEPYGPCAVLLSATGQHRARGK